MGKILELFSIAAYAQPIDLQPSGNFAQLGQLTIQGVIGGLVRLVLVVVALVFFFILILGGLKWITSGGDKGKVEAARNQITHALIGLAIVFVAWAIIRLLGTLFGIPDILNLEIPTLTG